MDLVSGINKLVNQFVTMNTGKSVLNLNKEWRIIYLTIVVVLFITSIPYYYAYQSAPPDKQFMGILLNVPDHIQYFSWMRELSHANLAANKLTPEPNKAIFFNLLWWGLGRLDVYMHLGYAGMFQVLRLVATTLFLLLLYRMCSWFFQEKLQRLTAFFIVLLTSGLGWVLVVFKYTLTKGELLFPLDLYVAESNTFFSILAYPHFIAALLYVFIFDLFLRGEKLRQYRYAVGAGLFGLFLGWQHAYDLLSIYAILGVFVLLLTIKERKLPEFAIKSCIIIGVISFWPALYSVLLTSLDPLWKEVLDQFDNAGVFTPNILHLFIFLGLTYFLAIFTVIKDKPLDLPNKDNNQLFIMGWFLVSYILVYLPVDYQIHLLNGWQIPIGFLATSGIFKWIIPGIQRWSQKVRPGFAFSPHLFIVPFLLFISLTNVYLYFWRFYELSRHEYPFYLYKDELAALSWLEKNASGDDVVLASLTFGQYVPAWTGAHTFLGHWAQTVDFYTKSEQVSTFYRSATQDADRVNLLNQYGVDYVVAGPAESSLGDFNPEEASYLMRVFKIDKVAIYEVIPSR